MDTIAVWLIDIVFFTLFSAGLWCLLHISYKLISPRRILAFL